MTGIRLKEIQDLSYSWVMNGDVHNLHAAIADLLNELALMHENYADLLDRYEQEVMYGHLGDDT